MSVRLPLSLRLSHVQSTSHWTWPKRQQSGTYQLVGDLVDDVAVVHTTSVVLHVLLDVDTGLVLIVGQVEVKPAQVQTIPLTQVPVQ